MMWNLFRNYGSNHYLYPRDNDKSICYGSEPSLLIIDNETVSMRYIKTKQLMKDLNNFFEFYILVPRIQIGKQQIIEILIHEEAHIFHKVSQG